MRKFLTSLISISNLSIVFAISMFFLVHDASAQCGISGYAGIGNNYTPSATGWLTTDPTGSGTYQIFNVAAGNIYSFTFPSSFTGLSTNEWDMTLSSSSAILNYDNINTPIPNSYTGGIACPNTTRPSSAVWDANYSGQLLVNINTWTGSCVGYVPGQIFSYDSIP